MSLPRQKPPGRCDPSESRRSSEPPGAPQPPDPSEPPEPPGPPGAARPSGSSALSELAVFPRCGAWVGLAATAPRALLPGGLVWVSRSGDDWGEAAAAFLVEVIRALIARRAGSVQVALSGGRTPGPVYNRLAAALPPERLAWFQIDERNVPPDHPDSNQGLIRRALAAGNPAHLARFHPIPVDPGQPGAAAARYAATLRRSLAGRGGGGGHDVGGRHDVGRRPAAPRGGDGDGGKSGESDGRPGFDLAVLGLGPDGHTASLFPGTPWREVAPVGDGALFTAWPVPDLGGAWRYTATLALLSATALPVFLVAGGEKAARVAQILTGQGGDLPAGALPPVPWWFLDPAAASGVPLATVGPI